MGEDLGVGLRGERVALREEAFLKLLVVFDHAVMYERDLARLIEMRVRVFIGCGAVRGPTRVTDADAAGGGGFLEQRGQVVDAASLLAQLEAAVVEDANTRGIVAAVFKPTKTFKDDAGGGLGTDV